ncbi:hypothetical protein EIP91_011016 [Steccherinum ochraceum]|uniref:Sugar phosphate phosphatase n=1 Tax=Steccherinum ochraceum TaxID=92696 RepID=A0A4R0R009_9APHY|nr:hypothetical protein EIP91_011016 [Steccherinum ochraceum]
MFTPPYPPYDPTDKKGFSYTTVVSRWPKILTDILNAVLAIDHAATMQIQTLQDGCEEAKALKAKVEEGQGVIGKISKLKEDMGTNKPLLEIPNDGEAMTNVYNEELEKLRTENKDKWFTAPWLFAECYLYRLIRSWFKQTAHWQSFDPFFDKKESTFKSSGAAIYQLAKIMHDLDAEKTELFADSDKSLVIFREMIQMCLWGNATDLSLLTHMSHEDIANLQSVGKDAQAARKEYILKDDQEAVWQHLKTLKDTNAKIDFVLDNAGFELFTDFVFADFLVTYTPYASRVVFHPKLIPWFVSDVTPTDFASTIPDLLSDTFFPPPGSTIHPPEGAVTPPARLEEHSYLRQMVTRWQKYLAEGVFSLSVPESTPLGASDVKADFWTSPYPYWDLKEKGHVVFEELKESGLVIFKGDLNYRKLTGDVAWPVSTPFETAIGPVAGAFPILSLRTNKADVVVGVSQEVADALDAKGEKWRVNGKYALVSFCPKSV